MAKRLGLPASMEKSQALNLSLFLRLISNFGQEVIHERASRCPCRNPGSHNPDFRCPVCTEFANDNEKGWIWKIKRYETVVERSCDLCLPIAEFENSIPTTRSQITKVFYAKNITTGEFYTVDEFIGNQVMISGNKLPTKFENTEVKYTYDKQIRETVYPVLQSDWQIKVAKGSITEIHRIENITKDEIYTVENFTHDTIAIDGLNKPEATDTIEVDYEYIPPLTGLITGVSPDLRMTAIGEVRLGDATFTVDPLVKIGYYDRVTLLNQDEKESEILTRGKKDTLRYPEIVEIVEIFSLGNDETELTYYTEGLDFSLSGKEIVWLEGGNSPLDNRQYTVTYFFRPVYRVYVSLPLVRTPSNDAMPRRVMLRRDDIW
jgi:hypothetical protein